MDAVTFRKYYKVHVGFPGGTSGKESACQCRRLKRPGFHLWKIPWSRAWQLTPAFLPGESHGQRYLVGYGPEGHKESDMILWLSTRAQDECSLFGRWSQKSCQVWKVRWEVRKANNGSVCEQVITVTGRHPTFKICIEHKHRLPPWRVDRWNIHGPSPVPHCLRAALELWAPQLFISSSQSVEDTRVARRIP